MQRGSSSYRHHHANSDAYGVDHDEANGLLAGEENRGHHRQGSSGETSAESDVHSTIHDIGARRVRDLIFAESQDTSSSFYTNSTRTATGDVHQADYGYRLLDKALTEITGRFQLLLTVLCALTNFVDAAETTMMGLLYPSLMAEFNLDEKGLAIVPSLTNIGMLFGALSIGKLSDVVGRKKTLFASLVTCALFGFLSSFANSIVSLALLRMCLGFGYGGNLVTSTTLLVEYLAHHERGVYTMWCGVGFGIGALLIAAISLAVVPTLGWRWLLRIAAFMSIPVICMLYFVPESPRFFIMRHQYFECVRSLDYVAMVNGKRLPHYFNAATLNVLHHEPIHRIPTWRNCFGFMGLLRKPILVTLIPLSGCWFLNAFASVLSSWIPIHGREHFQLTKNIVYNIALVQASGILLGTLLQVFMVRHYGRRIQMRVGFVLSALALLLLGFFAYASLPALYTLAFFIQFTEQVIIMTLYLYTPEAFPTAVRVTAFGVCQAHHRFAPIIAPYVIASLDRIGFNVTCFVFAGVFLLGAILAMTLRVSTFNAPLLEEADLEDSDLNKSVWTNNPEVAEIYHAPINQTKHGEPLHARPEVGVI
eukprot:CAMPEP_0171566328 /NCGR_PEP_ID=MMETSP0961-20121227/498_1 /TAXON_ID=87120 /ORGANISM="Aurantiochytrium limacinum, Strain ATCCMYA-1381" /LENGTH=591 /DNA_ID=CAMNT_0012120035 /DNA_START=125 /DNA_END=1900 /DNA_ORIENTATION=+